MKIEYDKKNSTKPGIVNYIWNHKIASKVELSKQLNLSMPTVLSNVKELIDKGLVIEVGECESTGGRKAKSLGIQKSFCYSLGIDITMNHMRIVLVNLCGEIEKQERKRIKFTTGVTYCGKLAGMVEEFLADTVDRELVLGIGISLPGIINDKVMVRSHALQLENYSLKMIEQLMPLPVYFENDANAAMLAENPQKYENAVYLSLSNTLGGAVCMNGNLFTGQNQKAGEFGHMILVPKGRTCYCGKAGCADAYCAASVLTRNNKISLEEFMARLEQGEPEIKEIWEEYLSYLAIFISNLRMAYDTDIILGGDVGGYLQEHMIELGGKIFQYNLFDRDLSYLKNCGYQNGASAIGVAKHFFKEFVEQQH